MRLPDPGPPVTLAQAPLDPSRPEPPPSMNADRAVMRIPRGGFAVMDRAGRTGTFYVPSPLSDQELVHPCLSAVAASFSHWDGRLGFHAGAFVADGRGWAVLGTNEAGKSTALAALAARGIPVLADDFLSVDGTRVFAGPRSIDLREGAVDGLGLEGNLEPSRGSTRWRLRLGDVQPDVQLGGWFFLRWGENLEVAEVPPQERIRELPLYRPVKDAPASATALLDLTTLPAWRGSRARRWDAIDDVVEALLGTVRSAAQPRGLK